MSTKRKQSVLSIKDKQIIISRLDKGEKGTNLALEFDISKQQISDICKNKDKILKFTDNIETSEGLKRKSLKLANDERLDQALYTWFIQQRSTGTPISGPLLQEKAKHFSMQLNGESADHESFRASTGWLDKFKNRHGMRNLSIQGVSWKNRIKDHRITGSRIKDQRSKIKDQGSRIKDQGSRIKDQGSPDHRIKDQGSRIKDQGSRIKDQFKINQIN